MPLHVVLGLSGTHQLSLWGNHGHSSASVYTILHVMFSLAKVLQWLAAQNLSTVPLFLLHHSTTLYLHIFLFLQEQKQTNSNHNLFTVYSPHFPWPRNCSFLIWQHTNTRRCVFSIQRDPAPVWDTWWPPLSAWTGPRRREHLSQKRLNNKYSAVCFFKSCKALWDSENILKVPYYYY